MHLVCFTLGFVAGGIPNIIQQYVFRKNLESLGGEADMPEDSLTDIERYGEGFSNVVEDADDIREREKREEEEIGFW